MKSKISFCLLVRSKSTKRSSSLAMQRAQTFEHLFAEYLPRRTPASQNHRRRHHPDSTAAPTAAKHLDSPAPSGCGGTGRRASLRGLCPLRDVMVRLHSAASKAPVQRGSRLRANLSATCRFAFPPDRLPGRVEGRKGGGVLWSSQTLLRRDHLVDRDHADGELTERQLDRGDVLEAADRGGARNHVERAGFGLEALIPPTEEVAALQLTHGIVSGRPGSQRVERRCKALSVIEVSPRHHVEVKRYRRASLQPSRNSADHTELDLVLDKNAQEPLGVELGHPCLRAISCRRA